MIFAMASGRRAGGDAGLRRGEEGSGCGAFRWSLDHERAALIRPDKPPLANGGALAYDQAMTLELAPFSAAGLPKAPERAPKAPQSFAGHFTIRRAREAGRLQADDLVGKLDRRPRQRRTTCIRPRSPAPPRARARARASSSTCPPAPSQSSSAGSRTARFPSSSRPTSSLFPSAAIRATKVAGPESPKSPGGSNLPRGALLRFRARKG